jgi:hypothetical protein
LVSAVTSIVGSLSLSSFGLSSLSLSRQFEYGLVVNPIPLAVGAFLLSTLRSSSSQGKWIGFQFLCGYFAAPGILNPSTILRIYPVGKGFNAAHVAIAFAEGIGSAIGIAAAQSTLLNTLKPGLERAGVQPNITFASGATTLKYIIPQQATKLALEVYDTALTHTFYVSAGSACLALLSLALLIAAKKYKSSSKPRVPGYASEEGQRYSSLPVIYGAQMSSR